MRQLFQPAEKWWLKLPSSKKINPGRNVLVLRRSVQRHQTVIKKKWLQHIHGNGRSFNSAFSSYDNYEYYRLLSAQWALN